MSKTAATEADLGRLHTAVARIMSTTLRNLQKAQDAFEEALEAAAGDPDAVMAAIAERPEVSPALLAAVTKFLSDNKITCQVEESEALSETAKVIAEKQKRRKAVGNVVHLHDDT